MTHISGVNISEVTTGNGLLPKINGKKPRYASSPPTTAV
jgi:hypothetical protein